MKSNIASIAIAPTRSAHPALWLVTWDPSQPTATRPLAIQKDGTWFTYGYDITKNICEVFGQHGYIRTAYSYAPFGSVSASGDVTQPLQWSSEHYDSELDLVYYNYRHYSPSLGRFLSRDPIAEQGGLNLYAFVGNSPTKFYDINGNFLGIDLDFANSLQVGGCIPIPAIPSVYVCLTGGYTLAVDECCQGSVKKQMAEISGDINLSVVVGTFKPLSLSYTKGAVVQRDNPGVCPEETSGIKGSVFVGFNAGVINGQCIYDFKKNDWNCSGSFQFRYDINAYGGGSVNFYGVKIR